MLLGVLGITREMLDHSPQPASRVISFEQLSSKTARNHSHPALPVLACRFFTTHFYFYWTILAARDALRAILCPRAVEARLLTV